MKRTYHYEVRKPTKIDMLDSQGHLNDLKNAVQAGDD